MISISKMAIGACVGAAIGMAGFGTPALGTNFYIDRLQQSPPVAYGGTIPNNAVYNLPGVGNVTVTYNYPAYFTQNRGQSALITVGNVTSGSDNYAWTNYELFDTVFTVGPDPIVPIPWT